VLTYACGTYGDENKDISKRHGKNFMQNAFLNVALEMLYRWSIVRCYLSRVESCDSVLVAVG